MEEKNNVLSLMHFLHPVIHKVMIGVPLDYEEAYILNDLANQLHDSRSVLEIERKYKSDNN